MNLELSTVNVLLGCVITLQVWIVRQVFELKKDVALLTCQCPMCRPKHDL